MFDPLDLLTWLGGGVVLLLAATPVIRRRESERMRRTLEDALGEGPASTTRRPPNLSGSSGAAPAGP